MRKIALAHLGKSKHFIRDVNSVDNDFQRLLINLARNNPDDHFYGLQCRGDSTNRKMFPHQNVTFIKSSTDPDHYINALPEDVDLLIMYSGISSGGRNIHLATIDKNDPTQRAPVKFGIILRYCSPLLKWINHTNIKYIALSNDPRSSEMRIPDLHNRPFKHYAQSHWEIEFSKFASYDDITKVPCVSKVEYWPIEQIKLVDIDLEGRETSKKTTLFGVVCNEGSEEYERQGVNQRWPILKDWILSSDNPNIEIYGKWHQKYLEQDSRMKGSIPFLDLQEKIKHWKYSLCIPIKDGWTTGKYCEMIEHKIVPFLYPGYDSFKLVNFPKILRVEKPSDIWERIEFLEQNPDEYDKLWEQLDNLVLNDDVISGKMVNEFVYSFITDNEDYTFDYHPPKVFKWQDYFQSKVLVF